MNFIFKTLNKPAAKNNIDKMLYDGYESTVHKSLSQDFYKVREQLDGLEIIVTLDFAKSSLNASGDIPEDKEKIVTEIINKYKKAP